MRPRKINYSGKKYFTIIHLNAIHLYGMAKKEFFSKLFKKTIKTNDPEYSERVLAEALYRLREYEEKNCTCMICQNSKQKLKEWLEEKFRIKNTVSSESK